MVPELLHVGHVLRMGRPSNSPAQRWCLFSISRKGRYILGAAQGWGKRPATTQLRLPCQKPSPVLPKLLLLLRRAKIQISFYMKSSLLLTLGNWLKSC